MEITPKLLTKNHYSRSGEIQPKIEYIVVHWVGNANTSALANRNYFENLKVTHNTQASAHYIIGLNGEILQCIPDNEVAFHSGNYNMNRKSIGIENCHPDWEGKFNDLTYESLVDLLVYLCKKYFISVNKIIRHYDVTGKICPKYYVNHNAEWEGLKNRVRERLGQEKPKEEEFEMAKTYKNGSTSEICYKDCDFKTKTGSLDKYEICECLGIVVNSKGENAYIVKYKINNSNNQALGFVKYNGGIK